MPWAGDKFGLTEEQVLKAVCLEIREKERGCDEVGGMSRTYTACCKISDGKKK